MHPSIHPSIPPSIHPTIHPPMHPIFGHMKKPCMLFLKCKSRIKLGQKMLISLSPSPWLAVAFCTPPLGRRNSHCGILLKSQALLLVRDWHQNAPDHPDSGNIPLCRFVLTHFPELFQFFEVIPPLQCVRFLPDTWRFAFIMPVQPNIQLGATITPQMPSCRVLPLWCIFWHRFTRKACFCGCLNHKSYTSKKYESPPPRENESPPPRSRASPRKHSSVETELVMRTVNTVVHHLNPNG